MLKKASKQSHYAEAGRDRPKIVLIASNVRSLHNVGSFFRTGDAYGVEKIYLCGYTGAPPRKEISKVALGAESWIPWEKRTNAWRVVEELREAGFQIISLEQGRQSIPITEFKPKYPLALVLGNEVRGVTKEILKRSDAVVHLPMYGKKESLNVSVAAGIALSYLRYRK